jgi:hypothetical protein
LSQEERESFFGKKSTIQKLSPGEFIMQNLWTGFNGENATFVLKDDSI